MTSIGETLRRERLRQGFDLQQLSESTKIGTRMLQAREADDFSKLPGGVFTRSFIRQYATALGMEPGVLEPELKALQVAGDEGTRFESRKVETQPERTFSSFVDRGPDSNSLLVSAVWVVLALLVCGGVYYIMNRTPAPVPAASETASRPAPAAVQPAPEKPPESKPAPPPVVGSGPVQVVLSALEPAWVSVTADGKSAYVGVLQTNEKKEINASERVKVVAGNAGGIEISLNGHAIDSIGPKGQVRTVELTPAGAHVIPRTPLNPSPLL
jgi:cytoskeletal protein RodZ